jgi:cytochrome c553
MRALTIMICLAVAFSANSSDAQIGEPFENPITRAGKDVAVTTCVACHVVSTQQDVPPVDGPAPSFEAIANRPEMKDGTLVAFMDRCAQMTTYTERCGTVSSISEDERSQVAAYIMTLRTRQ